MRARLPPPRGACQRSHHILTLVAVNDTLVGECNLKRGESALLQEGSFVVFGSQGHLEPTLNPHVMEVRGKSREPHTLTHARLYAERLIPLLAVQIFRTLSCGGSSRAGGRRDAAGDAGLNFRRDGAAAAGCCGSNRSCGCCGSRWCGSRWCGFGHKSRRGPDGVLCRGGSGARGRDGAFSDCLIVY